MIKDDSSGTTPKDIDLVYDTQKVGAGWNLYMASLLTSTAATVTDTTKLYKAKAPWQFSFPSTTIIDFGAFLEAEPEAHAIS